MVKHSVGQTVVQSPQKQHFAISISNFAACKRTGEPSEVVRISSGDLIASISMQSTVQTLAHLCFPVDASDDALGFEAISQVKPGGHFFETTQTMDRYRGAFYAPLNAELSNFGTWTNAGSETADVRATKIWQDILRDFKSPKGSQHRAARIADYITKGTAAGGAPLLD